MPRRFHAVERLEQVAREGFLGGYARLEGHRKLTLKLAMDCEGPYRSTMYSRTSARHGKIVEPITIWLEAQCRKCFSCKRRRSMLWQGRALTEYMKCPRTLFGTITMSVHEQLGLDDLITLRLARGRVDFNKLSPIEIFEERVKEFGAEVTKYLDRITKGCKGPLLDHEGRVIYEAHPGRIGLRYLLIAEVHDSDKTSEEMRGRPHFHLLLHEQAAGQLVHGDPQEAILSGERSGEYIRKFRKDRRGRWEPIACVADDAFIRKNWTLGFTNFQWAQSANSAVYVCKYLSKSLMLRVRSSQHYGSDPDNGPMDRVAFKYTEGKVHPQDETSDMIQQQTVLLGGVEGNKEGSPRPSEGED